MDWKENKVTISYEPELIGPRSLIKCIEEARDGSKKYTASLYNPPNGRESERQVETKMYRDQFLLSSLFSVLVFLLSILLFMLHPYGQ